MLFFFEWDNISPPLYVIPNKPQPQIMLWHLWTSSLRLCAFWTSIYPKKATRLRNDPNLSSILRSVAPIGYLYPFHRYLDGLFLQRTIHTQTPRSNHFKLSFIPVLRIVESPPNLHVIKGLTIFPFWLPATFFAWNFCLRGWQRYNSNHPFIRAIPVSRCNISINFESHGNQII